MVAAPVLVALAAASGASYAAVDGADALPRFDVAQTPAWSPDGQRIVFTGSDSPTNGFAARTLYAMKTDGSGVGQVTPDGFDATWPTWSPDGRKIAFEHTTAAAGTRASSIYIVSIDGTGLRLLTSNGEAPAWGPGGKKIAFSRGGRIYVTSPDGAALRVVADPGDECESYKEPTWSPDGEFVAFAAWGSCDGPHDFTGASRGYGARVKVVADGLFEGPKWSPDGKAIAAGSALSDTVVLIDVRAHYEWALRSGWNPDWSPDGKRLVFVRGTPFGPRQKTQIYVMNADGFHLRQLTRST